jgi:hypothetical protein
VIASFVPATTTVNNPASCSSLLGSKIYFHSLVSVIFTQETGHSKGAQAISKPRLAQVIPKNHKSHSQFEERGVAII